MEIIRRLLSSKEPSIRFKTHVNILGEENSAKIRKLQDQIKKSPRVRMLLSERDKNLRIPYHPYCKWYGAHWVLVTLADIGYPAGDMSLVPLREQVYSWLLSKQHRGRGEPVHVYTGQIKIIKGRARIHASMEGNTLFGILTLGLYDKRADELAKTLIETQWPDGGWNCDKRPTAHVSSFTESLIPLRALALYAKTRRSSASRTAVERAVDFFLKRNLYKRQHNGKIIKDDFVRLHYPCYWHYDILFGLRVMVEAGFIRDRRCEDAIALLESKRLPDGGFAAEKKYYKVTNDMRAGRSLVDWGGANMKEANEFVTADAFYVLKSAGKI